MNSLGPTCHQMSPRCDKHTKAKLFPIIKQIKAGLCVDLCDVGPVSVYLSLLLSCALQVQQEKWKRVTQIRSSKRFLFAARHHFKAPF